jgi:hypothetical protein
MLFGTTCDNPGFSPGPPVPTFCERHSSCRAPATSAAELILQLRDAYYCRDYPCFANLFSTAADSAEFRFFPNEPPGTSWDLTEILRIHRRMFRPEDPLPGETPVPEDLWLVAIDIILQPQAAWAERPDLYRSETNPGGLDPRRWVATEALHNAYVFFKMSGDTDYQVNCRCNFVVLEDLRRQPGQERKFLFYRWEDLGSITAATLTAVSQATWTQIMRLYK